MKYWSETRTAAMVVRRGTIKAAADALGLHRATVTRHVDTLEHVMGEKLFQRNRKGYVPTEAGKDLLRVADEVEDQFLQLVARSRNRSTELSGELVVTSPDLLAPRVLPTLRELQRKHRNLKIRYLADDRHLKLEYGEAHIAFRTGERPREPENVSRQVGKIRFSLFASTDYLERFGHPETADELLQHRFVGSDNPKQKSPFFSWMRSNVPIENIIFLSGNMLVAQQAVVSGCGIGFLPVSVGTGRSDMVQVIDPQTGWEVPIWLATHVDLDRSAKVQEFLQLVDYMDEATEAASLLFDE